MHLIAQDAKNPIIPDTPPSPQAVAFNRLGDYEVNNNYGAPDINIPLWEIDFHGYKIPLSLHYEAKPLTPGYNYDVTGLGWTLSGNSCVSRTIKDRADELPGQYQIPSFTMDSFADKNGKGRIYKNEANTLNKLNFQYDTYKIVLPSGRTIPFFMYVENWGSENEQKTKPLKFDLLYEDRNIKIQCNVSNRNKINASIDSFVVTDENGITYYFTLADKSLNSYTNALNADRNVAWLLTSIDIPAKGTITYNYHKKVQIHTYNPVPEPIISVHRVVYQDHKINEIWRNTGFQSHPDKFTVMKTFQDQCSEYEMRFLASINYGSTVVNFNYADDNMHMKEIVVSDKGNSTGKYEIIRKFALNVDESSSVAFLNSIVISGQNDTDKLVYGFDYYKGLNLGNYTDYWGYRCRSNNNNKDVGSFNVFFNTKEDDSYLSEENLHINKNNAQLCTPKETDPYYYRKIKLQSTLDGDTRKPAQPNEHGILTKIIYPNGGYTEFDWENHRFPTATAEDGDFVYDRRKQRIIEGGGFRIKSIINYTADKKIASQNHYRYGFTYDYIIGNKFPLPVSESKAKNHNLFEHIGCGEAVVDPNVLTFMDFSLYYENPSTEFVKMILGMDSKMKDCVDPRGYPIWWDADFSANTFRALLGGRQPVVYPEITVYHGNPDVPNTCKSKTVYRYDIYDYKMDTQKYYLTTIYQSGKKWDEVQLDTAYFEPVRYLNQGAKIMAPKLICDEISYKRHLLKSMSDYSYNGKTWNLTSEIENKYLYFSSPISKMGYEFNSYNTRGWDSFFDNVPWSATDACNPYSEYCYISLFYKGNMQKLGSPAKLTQRSTTTLRQGGTRNWNNTQTESYDYLYSGVMKSKTYTDGYDKENVYSGSASI